MEVSSHIDQSITFRLTDEKCNWGACEAFIDDLKATIPWRDRSYDPDTYQWNIDGSYREAFQDLCDKHFGDSDQTELSF